jgi:hypothetical protein
MPDRAMTHRRPSDRFYAVLHWTFMGVIALVVLYGFVAPRLFPIGRPTGFRLFILLVVCMNILWWSIADRRFARYVASAKLSLALRILVALFAAALNAPIAHMIVKGGMPAWLNTSPTWYSAAVTLWQLGLVLAMPAIAAVRLVGLAVQASIRRLIRGLTGEVAEKAAADVNLGRRAWLMTAFGTVPMVIVAGGTAASRWHAGRFEINRRQVPAPWLPERLRGLTITHISDLHVGRLYRPYMLPRLVDEVNRLNSDILIITGDIVDLSNEMLPPSLGAIVQMRHRHGAFACIGNHDEIDDRAVFIREVRGCLPLLIDEWRVVEIGGERLTISGVGWARQEQSDGRRQGLREHVLSTLSGYEPQRDGPMIALAHHPHAWDHLSLSGVPLVLSGHTHGGQIMFTPPDSRPDAGAGAALFRYIRGVYQRPGTTLFVNRGVGNWFPLRINAAAEIVQLQLV